MKKGNKILNKQRLVEFIRNNPRTTYKEIREKIKLHPERYFKSLKDGFLEAGIKPPRAYKIRTIEEKRKIIVDFIKKYPNVGSQVIKKQTKINICAVFKSIRDAYKEAGIKYPRGDLYKTSPENKRKEIIKLVKENPYITLNEIIQKTGFTDIYRLFKNLDELYEKAGVKRIGKGEKRKNRKRKKVIEYIKNNTLATQREINQACKTHVQNIFEEGIFEAYKEAGVEFPYERSKLFGASLKKIKKRARTFEDDISIKLSGYGKVNRLVKTKRGFADIILERKNEKIIIEIKDYKAKDISISQIKQLNKYLEDCKCNLGILICHKKPRKDKFLIGKNKIFILEKQELYKIPNLTRGA